MYAEGPRHHQTGCACAHMAVLINNSPTQRYLVITTRKQLLSCDLLSKSCSFLYKVHAQQGVSTSACAAVGFVRHSKDVSVSVSWFSFPVSPLNPA